MKRVLSAKERTFQSFTQMEAVYGYSRVLILEA